MSLPLPVEDMLDVAFSLAGQTLPRDHAWDLSKAICRHLPWLAQETQAGVHPLKLVPGTQSSALLSGRARLLLRVPRSRMVEVQALSNQALDVQGCHLVLGEPVPRKLQAHSTLYAYRVAAPSADEVEFMAMVAAQLTDMGVTAHQVCGLHQTLTGPAGRLQAFSLMLHGLEEAQSLRVQQQGLGEHRLLGCGVFVPHKSAAAV